MKDVAARMWLRILLRRDDFRRCLLRTRLFEGRGMSGAAAAYKANGRPAKDDPFRGHTWLLRGAWGRCLWMRPPWGERVNGGCHPQTRPWMAAEVVASADGTVPTAVEDVAHVNTCSPLALQSRARHSATAFCLCVLCPVVDSVKKNWDTTGRMDAVFIWTPKQGSSARQTRKT